MISMHLRRIPGLSGARPLASGLLLLIGAASGICGAVEPVATKFSELDTESEVMSLAYSSEGSLLAVEGFSNGVQVWDVEKHQRVASNLEGDLPLGEHELEFSPDGRWLVSCHGGDVSLDVYDTAHWKVAQAMPKGPAQAAGGCEGAIFSPDSKKLLRLQTENVIDIGSDLVLYDTATWRVVSSIRTQPYIAAKASFAGLDGCKEPLTQVNDRMFLDLTDARSYFGPFSRDGFSISADGRFLALAGKKGSLCNQGQNAVSSPYSDGRDYVAIVDLTDRKLVRLIEAGTSSIDWSPSGQQLALGPYAGERGGRAAGPIRIIDVNTGATLATEPTDEDHVHLRYARDGKYLIESIGKKVEIWDQRHEKLLQVIHEAPNCFAVSADGRFLALGGGPINITDSFPLLSLVAHPNGPKGKVIIYRLQ